MNFQQLEYIVAVDSYRHFGKAAQACFVTQPTLSMMIQKLEEDLGGKIFDRSKKPVVPTETGVLIIHQAKKVLRESEVLREIVQQQKTTIEGQLKLGIIPTLAPYLVPLFIQSFLKKHPDIYLRIAELTTLQIIAKLKKGELDAGILVTPLQDAAIKERTMFYEPFWVYSSHSYKKKYLLPDDIDPNELWLLEEGHCLRSQILNLCELRKQSNHLLQYENGSIETFKRLVENKKGITILPELATLGLSKKQRKLLKPFKSPTPVREVSLVTHQNFIKERMIEALQKEILSTIPAHLKDKKKTTTIDLDVA